MQLHNLKPKIGKKNKKRIGRGGKRGTYSGRGIKGQKARAGHRMRPEMRDILKKIPKLRGYRSKIRPNKIATVNIGDLEKKFVSGDKITPQILVKSGLLKKIGGQTPAVKLLGSGEITKKLMVSDCQISGPAKDKIEKAGGTVSLKNNKN
ncbi:MAG: 50S ribosomal protein L15 [Candidatus Niyogibacteria bacterium RIFCSPLOWO2_01_FULL_45_48]|uniref:Large ribosomal subunit protein uL15 n=2 Tax=Candidatus Niyogiibacteriota TaxID=1817912 RepID=A0A1G2EZD1_9BACT|nr:MAG: 50S ribosomal protein L15 [Candidatus Niyogibacteria bacterium RIFCSPHIGHO2_01_FULL_45_28]OGZ30731.1 MAG: 50S ribosomal protein L15 [Candidatus Niyogibacteria bacterium RIFCSPLOWO2_01_FULL_45_48]OGZ31184.1 MAG: 50S ribosomal protein L15 [Candidatus Niyogibacteria bacterium RIFCSPLOWO2_02_FULL_45_13]